MRRCARSGRPWQLSRSFSGLSKPVERRSEQQQVSTRHARVYIWRTMPLGCPDGRCPCHADVEAQPQSKNLEVMRKFSEQYAKR